MISIQPKKIYFFRLSIGPWGSASDPFESSEMQKNLIWANKLAHQKDACRSSSVDELAGVLTDPCLSKQGLYSCGTATESHRSFPVSFSGWPLRNQKPNISPFSPNENRFHIRVSKRFADHSPATPLVDWHAATTNQAGPRSHRIHHSEEGNLGWLAGDLNEETSSPRICLIHESQCKRAVPRDSSFEDRSMRSSSLSGWPEGKFH